jgi:hypothetical protein
MTESPTHDENEQDRDALHEQLLEELRRRGQKLNEQVEALARSLVDPDDPAPAPPDSPGVENSAESPATMADDHSNDPPAGEQP